MSQKSIGWGCRLSTIELGLLVIGSPGRTHRTPQAVTPDGGGRALEGPQVRSPVPRVGNFPTHLRDEMLHFEPEEPSTGSRVRGVLVEDLHSIALIPDG